MTLNHPIQRITETPNIEITALQLQIQMTRHPTKIKIRRTTNPIGLLDRVEREGAVTIAGRRATDERGDLVALVVWVERGREAGAQVGEGATLGDHAERQVEAEFTVQLVFERQRLERVQANSIQRSIGGKGVVRRSDQSLDSGAQTLCERRGEHLLEGDGTGEQRLRLCAGRLQWLRRQRERAFCVLDGGARELPQLGGGGVGRRVGALRRLGCGIGEQVAVDLAVWGERDLGDRRVGGREHPVGESLGEEGAQLRGLGRPAVGGVVGGKAAFLARAQRGADRLVNARVTGERGLDFAELDPVAVNLDLGVGAALKLDQPAGPPAAEIAGAVEPLARSGMGEERVRGALRVLPVAFGESLACDMEFAADPLGAWLEVAVEDVETLIRERAAIWDRAPAPLEALDGVRDRPDRGLGRSAEADQLAAEWPAS